MALIEFYRSIKRNWLSPQSHLGADSSGQDQFLQSTALMHEWLYQSRDLTRIDFSGYLHHLVSHVLAPLVSDRRNIPVRVESEGVLMEIDTAVLCGSLVHELVLNAIRHGFPARRTGEIRVELGRDDQDRYRLTVQHTGIGLPSEADPDSGTHGMDLVEMLVDQLCGTIKVTGGNGTTIHIIFTGPHS